MLQQSLKEENRAGIIGSLSRGLRTTWSTPLARRAALEKSAIYLILLAIIIAASIISPVFLAQRNMLNMLRLASILGIVAIGQTFVILTGGIDLSVASVMSLMSILSTNMMQGRPELVISTVLVCLGISLAIGLANGLLVTQVRIPSFIVTVGMLLIVQGIRFVYSGGVPKGSVPSGFRFLGTGVVGGIPTLVLIVIGLGIVGALLLGSTLLGRAVYATGGNVRAAKLSGIRVDVVQIVSYMLCSLWAGIAGLLLTAWIGVADNWLGRGYELDSIAAAVIGGAALSGGKGSVWGSLAGALVIAILYNIVVLVGLDEAFQRVVKGVVIIGAVALYARLGTR